MNIKRILSIILVMSFILSIQSKIFAYVLTEEPQGLIDMSFDYDGTTLIVGSGMDTNGYAVDYNYLENGWTFSNKGSDTLKNGEVAFNTTHKVHFLNGLGGKDSDDKALALVTKKYRAKTGADSPAIQYTADFYNDNDEILYTEFDIYFEGTVAKNELALEYIGETTAGISVNKQFSTVFHNDGMITFAEEQITDNFTFGKWHNICFIYNPTAQTVAMRIDGVDYQAIPIASSDVEKYIGFSKIRLVQDFTGLKKTVDAISAVDNFRLYTNAPLPQLILNSSNENVIVLNTTEKIIAKNGADVLSAISAADGVEINVTSSAVTLSNTLYKKTYDIINTNDNIIYLAPVYITDPNDESMTVTARALYNGVETSAVALLGGYQRSGDNILKFAEISDYNNIGAGDVISVSMTVSKDCDDEFKLMIWNSFESILPLDTTVYKFNVRRPISVYMAGDSLMRAYNSTYYPQQGWGECFKYLLDSTVTTMYNAARGGESTRSFYYQLFDAKILKRIQPGDWVFFSFCHNDRYSTKTGTYNGSSYKWATTESEYAEYLQKFIDEVKAKGGNVIFVTGPNTGKILYEHENYPAIMKKVASDNRIECVDLYNIHNNYIKTFDNSLSTGDNVPEFIRNEMFLYKLVERGILTSEQQAVHPNTIIARGDSDLTHFTEKGASMLADWVAKDIKDNNFILKEYLK